MNQQLSANDLWATFNERFYYPNMHKGGPLEVELILSPKCNLACKYCYVNKYYHITYPDAIYDPNVAVDNAMKYLKALTKMGLAPDVDIFSGELFAQEAGFRLLERMLQHYESLPESLRPDVVSIPTNYTFICDPKLTERVQSLVDGFKELNISINLSASVEGKYMEENRPCAKPIDIDLKVVRDDAYYDRMFEFCKRNYFGFHPMLSAENIDKWIDNFNWWQQKLKEHDMEWDSVYILEVRNADYWTEEQLAEYQKFLHYIYFYALDKCKECGWDFLKWLLRLEDKNNDDDHSVGWDNGFNILMQPLCSNTNGIGCNIQQHTAVRCADLTIVPCHRLMYEQFHIAKILIDDDYNISYDCSNLEMGMVLPMVRQKIQPKCNTCPLNHICINGCLGAQYEATGDLFTPIPTICRLMLVKAKTMLDCLKESGHYHEMMKIMNTNMRKQYYELEKYLEEHKNDS